MTVNPSVHYLGVVGFAARDDHARCAAQWESIKAQHEDDYGPSSAYNQGGCVHGEEFEGRGDHRSGAANGQQGGVDYNPGSRSICIMVGTDDAIPFECFELVRSWANRQVANGMEWPLLSHSDFVATACCGDPLRQTVNLVNFAPGGFGPPSTPEPLANGGSTMIYIGNTLDGTATCFHWNGSFIDKRFDGPLEGPFAIPADALAFSAGSVPIRQADGFAILFMESETARVIEAAK